MNMNSENPKVSKAFQEMVCKSVEEYFQTDFDLEVAIPIGNPSRKHRFDYVSDDKRIVAECKCYTWTDTGNVQSGKMMA